MTQIELATTTETHDDVTYTIIEQSGQLGTDIYWDASAITEDHGRINIEATIYNAADLDNLIEQLEHLRTAARKVREVCGF